MFKFRFWLIISFERLLVYLRTEYCVGKQKSLRFFKIFEAKEIIEKGLNLGYFSPSTCNKSFCSTKQQEQFQDKTRFPINLLYIFLFESYFLYSLLSRKLIKLVHIREQPSQFYFQMICLSENT